MRARNLKPGFFKNDLLAECDFAARILFSGLWCLADRAGRLEYRPKKIKAEIFPYDNLNIDKLLKQLSDKKFIVLYSVSDENYIEIINFGKHQNCHIKEAESTIPAPCDNGASMEVARPLTESLLLNSESLLLNTAAPCKTRAAPPLKIKYLDSVFLSESEYQKLQEAIGQKSLDIGIGKLDYSITVKGGKYNDHYKTLLNWQKRGWLKEEDNGNGNGNRRSYTHRAGNAKDADTLGKYESEIDAINRAYYERQKKANATDMADT